METGSLVVSCRKHSFGPWIRDAEHRQWHRHCTMTLDGLPCMATQLLPPDYPLCTVCGHPLEHDVTPLGESVELACTNLFCRSCGQPKKHTRIKELDLSEIHSRPPTNIGLFGNNLGSYGNRKNRERILRCILKEPPFPYNKNPAQGNRVFLGSAKQRKKLWGDMNELKKYVAESEEPNPNLKRMKQMLSRHLQMFAQADDRPELLHQIAATVSRELRQETRRLPRKVIVAFLDAAFLVRGIPLIDSLEEAHLLNENQDEELELEGEEKDADDTIVEETGTT